MAIQIGSRNGKADVMADINTTPLIDVMLVLLVMIIVTVPIQTHKVAMTMPTGRPTAEHRSVVDVAVEFDGTVTWNGAVVPDRSTLDSYLAEEARKPDAQQSEIHLRPDRLVKYGAVAVVLADAQRIGVRKIAFAGNEQYME